MSGPLAAFLLALSYFLVIGLCAHWGAKRTAKLKKALLLEQDLRDEAITALIQERRAFRAFALNVWQNYDCDSDAHKYGTPCRACDARELIEKYGS